MARPRPIEDLDGSRPARQAARELLAVRADEVAGLARHLADPSRVTELHDMRVAVKRLRYLVDLLRPWIAHEATVKGVRKELSTLQDLLGGIHDCDVAVDAHRKLLARRLRLLRQRARRLPTGQGAADPELAEQARALGRELARGPARGLCLLVRDLVERRAALHTRLTAHWSRLEREGLLEQVVGLGAEAPPPARG